MTVEELTNILDSLLNLPAETEVVEFKKASNGFGDQELGQYFSALSNEANLKGMSRAWLVFGVENHTHEVVGSQYKNTRPALDAMKKRSPIRLRVGIRSSRYMNCGTRTAKEL